MYFFFFFLLNLQFFFLHLLQTKAFYSYWAEPAIIKNLKRGLASLFQFQLKTGKVIEVKNPLSLLGLEFCFYVRQTFVVWLQNDVSGRCTVEYRAVKGQVTRTKLLETCKTEEEGFTTHSQVGWHLHQLMALHER